MAVLFAAISGVGEGLHSLPGFGHAMACPGEFVAWCPSATICADAGTQYVGRLPGKLPPIRDPEQCPVCRHLSFSSPAAKAVVIAAVSDLVQELAVWNLPALRPLAATCAQARAPPSVSV